MIVYILVTILLFERTIFCNEIDNDQKRKQVQEKILFDSRMVLTSFLQTIKSEAFDALTIQQQLQVINGYRIIYEYLNKTQYILELI